MQLTIDPTLHLKPLGGTSPSRGDVPSGSGDVVFSRGLALHFEGTVLVATIRAWSTNALLEFEIPLVRDPAGAITSVASGGMKYRRNLGATPLGSPAGGAGLFVDNGRYFNNSIGEYDTNPSTMVTSTVATIDPATGKLAGARRLTLDTSDKRTANICRVPQWLAGAHLGGGEWFAAVGGGYYSVVATGPAHLGPSIVFFQLPDPATPETTPVPVIDVCAHPFGTNPAASPRERRPTDYWHEFNDGFPPRPDLTGQPGAWSWTEQARAGMTCVDNGQVGGFIALIAEGCASAAQQAAGNPGCLFYGHNDGSLDPCAGTTGTVAAINSSSKRHAWYVIGFDQVIEVLIGTRLPSQVKATRYEVQFPSVKYPMPRGLPSADGEVVGSGTAVDPITSSVIYGVTHAGAYKPDGTFNKWPVTRLYQLQTDAGTALPATGGRIVA